MQVLLWWPMLMHFYHYLTGKLTLKVCTKQKKKSFHTFFKETVHASSFRNILHIIPPIDLLHNTYGLQSRAFFKGSLSTKNKIKKFQLNNASIIHLSAYFSTFYSYHKFWCCIIYNHYLHAADQYYQIKKIMNKYKQFCLPIYYNITYQYNLNNWH